MREMKLITMVMALFLLLACSGSGTESIATAPSAGALAFNNTAWQYDATNDVYYQLGITYCSAPQSPNEKLGIYVPGAYMKTKDNGDGTYTLIKFSGYAVNGYTAETAPMAFPVDTGGWAAAVPASTYNYSKVASYLKAGFVYVQAGCRGKGAVDYETLNNHLPWGVTDLKAAVRYLRVNKSVLPGSTDRIFSYGTSAGGAQSGLLGATGNATEYMPYLNKIGAAGVTYDKNTGVYTSTVSDAITGSLQYVPIASHIITNQAYEWGMGQYLGAGTDATNTRFGNTFQAALSDDLAAAYPDYINKIGLEYPSGNRLTLTQSATGIWESGSYYDFLKGQIELSLNNFLKDQTDANGNFSCVFKGVTYTTPASYFAVISGPTSRSGTNWINYNAATNTATITSVGEFIINVKSNNSLKTVMSSDKLDNTSTNFGLPGQTPNLHSLHFDLGAQALFAQNSAKYALYPDWKASYITDYTTQAAVKDEMGTTTLDRAKMSDQMYYTSPAFAGYGKSNVARYWRIHSGAFQNDVPISTEMNLYLALEQLRLKGLIEDVKFATVWNQYHTSAERTGTSTDNYIAWVIKCCQDQL